MIFSTWNVRNVYRAGQLKTVARELGKYKLLFTPNIIRQIKSRRMRWAGHVARMEGYRNVYRVLMGKPEGKSHLRDQGVDGRMGSEWILGRLAGGV
jgi:hypothetical protein